MTKPNPFQSFAHCWRFAVRRASQDGDTFHIVATGVMAAPRAVVSDRVLFARDDIDPEDIEASFDPFAPPQGHTGSD